MDLGHITLIRTIGKQLIEQGHEVFAVIKDTLHAQMQLNDVGITWIQAPFSHSVKPCGNIDNHADILSCRGYHDHLALAGLCKAWATIFRMCSPDRIICESSPTAALVARSLQIPVIAVDTGFFAPPLTDPLPSFKPLGLVSRSALRRKERSVLEIINKAQRLNGYPALDRFNDMFNVPTLWMTWPEINHFGIHNEKFHLGPIYRGTGKGAIFEWKTKSAPHAFAYLKPGHKHSLGLLSNLLSQEIEVIAYLPGWGKSVINQLPNRHLLTASDKPVNFDGIMDKTDFLVSHTGLGTVHSFLLNGKPQVMLPQQMEQYLLSKSIEKTGLGCLVETGIELPPKFDLDKLLALRSNAVSFSKNQLQSDINLKMLMENLTAS